MYYQDKINIENFLYQVGLAVNPYDVKIKTHRKAHSTDISDVSINIYGPRKYKIGHSSLIGFKDNDTKAKFSTLFIVSIKNADIEYPTDLTIIKNNKDISKQFIKIEDYIRLLYILSDKKIDHVYINVRSNIDFTGNDPKIENVKVEIDARTIMSYFKDNPNSLNPSDYVEQKLSEYNMTYNHETMKNIVTTFEMLKI